MLEIESQLESILPTALQGSIVRTLGMTASVADFPAPVGAIVEIERQAGKPLAAEVIGFRDDLTLVYLLEEMTGVRRGNRVRLVRTSNWLRVGHELLGRVVNAKGDCVDDKPRPALTNRIAVDGRPLPAMLRPRIDTPLSTGIRAMDGLLTCGRGQRMGIFAGSGVGKSVTLGMMARYASADVNVIALIGERGREVNEFIERDLGPAGLARSVVVVATSDEPALVRVRAAFAATAIAEYFRDLGQDVLLIMDSRDRPGGRRAPHHSGIHPIRFCHAAQVAGARRAQCAGQHHRVLFGAGRRRRPQRAGLRRRARVARWPHLVVAQAGLARALSGDRRAGQPEPLDVRDHLARAPASRSSHARSSGCPARP
jgi:hypothetical protein